MQNPRRISAGLRLVVLFGVTLLGTLGAEGRAQTAKPLARPAAGNAQGSKPAPASRPQVVKPVRPPATTGAASAGADPVRPTAPVVFSFDRYPTFEDHDAVAAGRENLLPVKFPVLPLYQVSEKLPGYVDPLRRISMLTFGTSVQSLSGAYATPDMYAEALARRAYTRAGLEGSELRPVEMGRVSTLEGVALFREHYTFESEGEKWDRIVLSSAFEEDGKVKYLKVVCHFPTEIRSMAVQELAYYTDHMHINRKPQP